MLIYKIKRENFALIYYYDSEANRQSRRGFLKISKKFSWIVTEAFKLDQGLGGPWVTPSKGKIVPRPQRVNRRPARFKAPQLDTSGSGGKGPKNKNKKLIAENPDGDRGFGFNPQPGKDIREQVGNFFAQKSLETVACFLTYIGTSFTVNSIRCEQFVRLQNDAEQYTAKFLQFQKIGRLSNNSSIRALYSCTNYFNLNSKTLEKRVYNHDNPNYFQIVFNSLWIIGEKPKSADFIPQTYRLAEPILEEYRKQVIRLQHPTLLGKTGKIILGTSNQFLQKFDHVAHFVHPGIRVSLILQQGWVVLRDLPRHGLNLEPFRSSVASRQFPRDSLTQGQVQIGREASVEQEISLEQLQESIETLINTIRPRPQSAPPGPGLASSSGGPHTVLFSAIARSAFTRPSFEIFFIRVLFAYLYCYIINKVYNFIKSLIFNLLPKQKQQLLIQFEQKIVKLLTSFYARLLLLVEYPFIYPFLLAIFLISYPLEWFCFILAALFYLFDCRIFVLSKKIQDGRVFLFFNLCYNENLRLKVKYSSRRDEMEFFVCRKINGFKNINFKKVAISFFKSSPFDKLSNCYMFDCHVLCQE